MNILALDGSGLVASVAVLTEEKILAEYSVNYKKTHSQTLLPMIDEVLKMLEMEPQDIDYIAVSNGPGSFTGLRICSSTAKGLGLALNKPLVAVPSLLGLAYNYEDSDKLICPMMDARRSQVYTALYEFEKDGDEYSPKTVLDQSAIAIEELFAKVNEIGKPVVFLGDGVPVYRSRIIESMGVPYSFAPATKLMQSAASVGRAAIKYINAGETVSAEELTPEYLRLSQAERERLERGASDGN